VRVDDKETAMTFPRPLPEGPPNKEVGRHEPLAHEIVADVSDQWTVIVGYADLIKHEVAEVHQKYADEILHAANRCIALLHQLVELWETPIEPIDLNGLLAEMEKMLRRIAGKNIRLATCKPSAIDPIYARRPRVEQAVLQLAAETLEAAPGARRLMFETAHVDIRGTRPPESSVSPGSYVVLRIGAGMEEAGEARVELCRRTGLAWQHIVRIMQDAGGALVMERDHRGGSTFTLYWPRRCAAAAVNDMSDAALIISPGPNAKEVTP
jgi:hypothetical protein